MSKYNGLTSLSVSKQNTTAELQLQTASSCLLMYGSYGTSSSDWIARTSTLKSGSSILPAFAIELDSTTNHLPFGWDEARKQLLLAALKIP